MCIHWWGNRTLSKAALDSFFLASHPSLPWLTTAWICPLELREGHRGWMKAVPVTKEMRDIESCAQEPHRALHRSCSFLFLQNACLNHNSQKEEPLYSWPRCWNSCILLWQATCQWRHKWDCFKFNLIKNDISDCYIVYCQQKVDGNKLKWLDVFFSLCNSSPFSYWYFDPVSSK